MFVSAKANYDSGFTVNTPVTVTIIISGHVRNDAKDTNVAAQLYYGSGTIYSGTYNLFGWQVILADIFTPIIGANLPGNPADYSSVTYESAEVFFNQALATPPYTIVTQFNLGAALR